MTEEKVMKMASLVNYQDDAIVSKTLLKHDGGNVTLFAFAKGQALSEHTSPFDAMIHVLDGSAGISLDGKKHTVEAGEMIHLPANIPHGLTATARFKMLLIMIK